MAKRYDLVTAKKYTINGEEKTAWKNIGTMVRFDATGDKPEGFIIELNMHPELDIRVFEQKPRVVNGSEDTKPEDIGF